MKASLSILFFLILSIFVVRSRSSTTTVGQDVTTTSTPGSGTQSLNDIIDEWENSRNTFPTERPSRNQFPYDLKVELRRPRRNAREPINGVLIVKLTSPENNLNQTHLTKLTAPFASRSEFERSTTIDPGFQVEDNQIRVSVSYSGSGDGVLDLVEVEISPRWGNRRYIRRNRRCAQFSINNLLEATELTKILNNSSCGHLRIFRH